VAEKRFLQFLEEEGIAPLGPQGISDRHLRRYIAKLTLSGTIKKYTTIKKYISMGVRRHHEKRSLRWIPVRDRPRVWAVMQGAKRKFKDTPSNQKMPLTVEILLRMRQKIFLGDSLDVCWWAAATLSFFCLLRKANVALSSVKKGAELGVLTRESIRQDIDKNLWLHLTHTKTIQFGERTLDLAIPNIKGDELCPTAALRTYMEVTKTRPKTETLFGYYKGAQWVPLTHSVFVKRLKDLLTEVGEEPGRYAGHSFRRGGATFAYGQAGLGTITIKALGDWVSSAFLLHFEVQAKIRLEGAQAMAAAVKKLTGRMRGRPGVTPVA